MILTDASVVIDGLRDASRRHWTALRERFPGEDWAMTHPTRMEILMGARNAGHWRALELHLSGWRHVDLAPDDWTEAARIYADLRQAGLTVRSPIDCCIAQVALSRNALLLHRDRDFDFIAQVRPALRLERIPPPKR